jgi:glycosyltransferase involved in cell wall biosynthesis
MTVLHLAANRWWTGSADPVIRLVSGLRARGHRVLLGVVRGDRFETKAREADIEPLADLDLRPRGWPGPIVRDVARLRRVIARERVDIVHAHHSHDHWLGWLAAHRAGRATALVRTFHNAGAVKSDALARWLYRRTAAVFAVSRAIESRLRDVGVAPARIAWIPGIADTTRFSSDVDGSAVRREFEIGDAPLIVTVSRLAANRGHEALLAGFRSALDKMPDAKLMLVGKGETRARLEALVTELALTDRVIFAGYRDRDLPAVVSAADCFVLMGAGSDESCRAALEAMAAARPVVARRVGALPETVVDGHTGVLLDDDAPDIVAAALLHVLGDRERAGAMGRAGRRRAEALFSADHAVDAVERVYRSLA